MNTKDPVLFGRLLLTLLTIGGTSFLLGCAGTSNPQRVKPDTVPTASQVSNASADSQPSAPTDTADAPMTTQDLQNARAIWQADPTPWGPVGVNCIDKLNAHWPDVQALFAPLQAFHPAAQIVGPASGLAALFVGVDVAQSDAEKRLAIIQAGLPMDVVVACSPIVLKPGELLMRLGIRVPRTGVHQ